MLTDKYQTVLHICLFLSYSVAANVCPYEKCSCAGSQIICEDLGLTAMPPLRGPSSGFTFLLMDGNKITNIPAGSLPSGLATISLTYNPIASMDDAAFDESSGSLTTLTFARVSFSRIPDAFLHLQSLQYLNIYDSKILDWNEAAMKTIGQTVIGLDLKNVGLTSWPTWLQYFTKLNELTLDVTTISSIPDHALDHLSNTLKVLSFSNGSLTSVPMTFSKLVSLEYLSLSSNKISNLTWLPQSSMLTTLSLNNNKISDANHLSIYLRQYGDSLQSIQLVDNQLKAIPNLSFLKQIETVDLSRNHLSDPISGVMPPALYEFDLSYNMLPSIPSVWTQLLSVPSLIINHNIIQRIRGTDFHPSMVEADLGYNVIRELTDTSFPFNFSVMTILLNDNPIVHISSTAFENLNSLYALNMANTQLTRMPLALASLVKLDSLDMTGCPGLVCTCEEKIVEGTIMSVSQVNGQCGELDIYEFYHTLSPSCP